MTRVAPRRTKPSSSHASSVPSAQGLQNNWQQSEVLLVARLVVNTVRATKATLFQFARPDWSQCDLTHQNGPLSRLALRSLTPAPARPSAAERRRVHPRGQRASRLPPGPDGRSGAPGAGGRDHGEERAADAAAVHGRRQGLAAGAPQGERPRIAARERRHNSNLQVDVPFR